MKIWVVDNNEKKRILATKNVAPVKTVRKALNLQQVSDAELEASRNPAYTYLVK